MSTLKTMAKRGTLFGAAAALVVATFAPATPSFADSLNPLTDRSLKLSSSAPGYVDTDGSGNSTYAPPGSGANGKQATNIFSFTTTTDSSSDAIKAITFKYCTTPDGDCIAPGNNGLDSGARKTNTDAWNDGDQTSDLNLNYTSATELAATTASDFGDTFNITTGDIKQVPEGDISQLQPDGNDIKGDFVVMYKDGNTWKASDDWALSVDNVEYDTGTPSTGGNKESTGANNYALLTNTTGEKLSSGTEMKVVFFANDNNYVTNPGENAFYVRIATYDDDSTQDSGTLLDGGVTVANVMNKSIYIQTRVLETMDFSVGTVDPNTLASDDGTTGDYAPKSTLEHATSDTRTTHGTCDPILMSIDPGTDENILSIGDQGANSSLSTKHTYITHSYWRLSSNSSAGATVYYSGVTLTNTVGDQIDEIGATAAAPSKGTEQFGLALDNGDSNHIVPGEDPDSITEPGLVSYAQESTYENGADNGLTAIDDSTDDGSGGGDVGGSDHYHTPRLWPLKADAEYANGTGNVNSSPDTKFAFLNSSNLIPVALASENAHSIDCATGKVRYIANIASTTPAGMYTTAINYIAAPQY